MRNKKALADARGNFLAFYTTDSVKNWIERERGFEKRSTFIHRKLEQVKKQEEL